MNPFGPILPPGSPLARVSVQRRSRVRMVVLIVVAVQGFVLMAILVQGCIQARHHAAAADSTMTDVLGSPGTLHASVSERLPVVVSAAQSCAPRMSAPPPALQPAAPATTPKAAPLPAAQGARVKKYSVVKGDTYSTIAKANGVSVSALAKANPGVAPKKLKIGQMLYIPVGGLKGTLPPSNATAGSMRHKQ